MSNILVNRPIVQRQDGKYVPAKDQDVLYFKDVILKDLGNQSLVEYVKKAASGELSSTLFNFNNFQLLEINRTLNIRGEAGQTLVKFFQDQVEFYKRVLLNYGAILETGPLVTRNFVGGMLNGRGMIIAPNWQVRNPRTGETTNTGSYIEVDNLKVRGTFEVFEFVANQIRATNGSLWVTSSAKASNTTRLNEEQETIYGRFGKYQVENYEQFNVILDRADYDFVPFREGDLLRIQRFERNRTFRINAIVLDVSNSLEDEDDPNFIIAWIDGSAPVEESPINVPQGDWVRIGHVSDSDRQGALFLTSDDGSYLDVLEELSDFDDSMESLKVRIGDLSKIYDEDFGGWLRGYGAYLVDNIYIKGNIQIANRKEQFDEVLYLRAFENFTIPLDWYELTDVENSDFGLSDPIIETNPSTRLKFFIETTSTPPESVQEWDMWFNPDIDSLFQYRFNPGSEEFEWVELDETNVVNYDEKISIFNRVSEMGPGKSGEITLFFRTDEPIGQELGDFWFNPDTGERQCWLIDEWVYAGNSFQGQDGRLNLPGAPRGSGLFLSSRFMGFYDEDFDEFNKWGQAFPDMLGSNSGWKTFMDDRANLALLGPDPTSSGALVWNSATGVLNIIGAIRQRFPGDDQRPDPIYRGEWDPTKEYFPGDFVTYRQNVWEPYQAYIHNGDFGDPAIPVETAPLDGSGNVVSPWLLYSSGGENAPLTQLSQNSYVISFTDEKKPVSEDVVIKMFTENLDFSTSGDGIKWEWKLESDTSWTEVDAQLDIFELSNTLGTTDDTLTVSAGHFREFLNDFETDTVLDIRCTVTANGGQTRVKETLVAKVKDGSEAWTLITPGSNKTLHGEEFGEISENEKQLSRVKVKLFREAIQYTPIDTKPTTSSGTNRTYFIEIDWDNASVVPTTLGTPSSLIDLIVEIPSAPNNDYWVVRIDPSTDTFNPNIEEAVIPIIVTAKDNKGDIFTFEDEIIYTIAREGFATREIDLIKSADILEIEEDYSGVDPDGVDIIADFKNFIEDDYNTIVWKIRTFYKGGTNSLQTVTDSTPGIKLPTIDTTTNQQTLTFEYDDYTANNLDTGKTSADVDRFLFIVEIIAKIDDAGGTRVFSQKTSLPKIVNGDDNFLVLLSSESVSIPAENDGEVNQNTIGDDKIFTNIEVFHGAVDITNFNNPDPNNQYYVRLELGTINGGGAKIENETRVVLTNIDKSVEELEIPIQIIIEQRGSEFVGGDRTITINKTFSIAKTFAGPGLVYRGEFDPDKEYFYSKTRRDAVKVGNDFYMTANPIKNGDDNWDPPGSSDDWGEFGAQFESVATNFLLAENAAITQVLTVGGPSDDPDNPDAQIGIIRSPSINAQWDNGKIVFSNDTTSSTPLAPGFWLGLAQDTDAIVPPGENAKDYNKAGFFIGDINGSNLKWDGNQLEVVGAIRQRFPGDDPRPDPIYRGEWDENETYYPGDFVTYRANDWEPYQAYIHNGDFGDPVITPSTGNNHIVPPSSPWLLYSSGGENAPLTQLSQNSYVINFTDEKEPVSDDVVIRMFTENISVDNITWHYKLETGTSWTQINGNEDIFTLGAGNSTLTVIADHFRDFLNDFQNDTVLNIKCTVNGNGGSFSREVETLVAKVKDGSEAWTLITPGSNKTLHGEEFGEISAAEKALSRVKVKLFREAVQYRPVSSKPDGNSTSDNQTYFVEVNNVEVETVPTFANPIGNEIKLDVEVISGDYWQIRIDGNSDTFDARIEEAVIPIVVTAQDNKGDIFTFEDEIIYTVAREGFAAREITLSKESDVLEIEEDYNGVDPNSLDITAEYKNFIQDDYSNITWQIKTFYKDGSTSTKEVTNNTDGASLESVSDDEQVLKFDYQEYTDNELDSGKNSGDVRRFLFIVTINAKIDDDENTRTFTQKTSLPKIVDGDDNFLVILSSEAVSIPAENDGEVSSSVFDGDAIFTDVEVFHGAKDITSSPSGYTVSFSTSEPSTVGVSVDGNRVIINSVDKSIEEVDVPIQVQIKQQGSEFEGGERDLTINKSFSIAKTFAGPGLVYRGEFDPDKQYFYSKTRRDAVKVGNDFYMTANPGKNGETNWDDPTDTGQEDWGEFGAQFESIATGFLLAEQAAITQVLTIGGPSEDPDNPDAQLGIIRTPGINAFWNGNEIEFDKDSSYLNNPSDPAIPGFWLGLVQDGSDMDDNTAGFFVGNPEGSFAKWSGTDFIVNGDITATNLIATNTGQISSFEISSNTLRNTIENNSLFERFEISISVIGRRQQLWFGTSDSSTNFARKRSLTLSGIVQPRSNYVRVSGETADPSYFDNRVTNNFNDSWTDENFSNTLSQSNFIVSDVWGAANPSSVDWYVGYRVSVDVNNQINKFREFQEIEFEVRCTIPEIAKEKDLEKLKLGVYYGQPGDFENPPVILWDIDNVTEFSTDSFDKINDITFRGFVPISTTTPDVISFAFMSFEGDIFESDGNVNEQFWLIKYRRIRKYVHVAPNEIMVAGDGTYSYMSHDTIRTPEMNILNKTSIGRFNLEANDNALEFSVNPISGRGLIAVAVSASLSPPFRFDGGIRMNTFSNGNSRYIAFGNSRGIRLLNDGDDGEGIQIFNSTMSGFNTLAHFTNSKMISNVEIHAPDFVSTSDKRLKENIEPLDDSVIELLNALNPVTFNFKGKDDLKSGFIADDVEHIISHLVNNSGKYKHMNYIGIIAYLVKAFQLQHKELQELKRKLG